MTCEHDSFAAVVEVSRITDGDGGPLTNLYADVRVRCADCGEQMRFIGVEPGLSPRRPMCEVGGLELRCPMQPESADPSWGTTGPGYSVGVHGASDN